MTPRFDVQKTAKLSISQAECFILGESRKGYQVGCFGASYREHKKVREIFWILFAFPDFNDPCKYGASFAIVPQNIITRGMPQKSIIAVFSNFSDAAVTTTDYITRYDLKERQSRYIYDNGFVVKTRKEINDLPVPTANGKILYIGTLYGYDTDKPRPILKGR